ncbi:MAG TPA: Ig-like domain-containing protein, partial [Terriglobales bacterium]
KPSDSQVEYGTTTAYGQSSALGSTLTTSHTVALTGLNSATTYNFRVKSRDSVGNLATSSNFTFKTLSTPDTTPPTVSITSPSSGAALTGIVTLTATASDNVAVAGVQFLVDGQAVGSEQTAAPYSFAWNSAAVANGSHTISATARDGSGNTATSAAIGVSVSNTVTASDFQKRCQAAGVIRCWGFDDAAATDAHVIPPFGSTVKQGQVVTDIFSSGTGSLRFTVPSLTGADTSGSFSLNFADDFSQQFGEGQEFYVQYRVRYNDVMLTTHFTNSNGFKMSITGEGDRTGAFASSCTTLELPLENSGQRGFPQGYHSCGLFEPLQVSIPNTFEFLDQPAAGCPHYGDQGFPQTEPPCFKYKSNEWITMQQHVKIGHWGQNDSTVEVWAADEGQTSRLIISLADFALQNDNPTQAKYGKIWLLPYQTNKDDTQVTGTGYVWSDDLIISTKRIPDPDVTSPNAPDLLSAVASPAVGTIQLNWRSNSAGTEQGFKVERCSGLANTCMASQGMFTNIATVGSNVTSFQDTGLVSGQLYTYRVKAFNSTGDSAYSGGACFNGGNPCYSQASPN